MPLEHIYVNIIMGREGSLKGEMKRGGRDRGKLEKEKEEVD